MDFFFHCNYLHSSASGLILTALMTLVSLAIGVCFGITWRQRSDRKTGQFLNSDSPTNTMIEKDIATPNVSGIDAKDHGKYVGMIDSAMIALFNVIGLSPSCRAITERESLWPWSLAVNESPTFIRTRYDSESVHLGSSLLVEKNASEVMQILSDSSLVTGLEGIFEHSEILQRSCGGALTITRMYSSAMPLLMWKRDFLISSCSSVLPNGTFVIASRSLHIMDAECKQQRRGENGYVRGVIKSCGFIIRPVVGGGCEIFHAAHLNMRGSSDSTNRSTMAAIATSTASMMEMIGLKCSTRSPKKCDALSVGVSISVLQLGAMLGGVYDFAGTHDKLPSVYESSGEVRSSSPELHHGLLNISADTMNKLEVESRRVASMIRLLYCCPLSSSVGSIDKTDTCIPYSNKMSVSHTPTQLPQSAPRGSLVHDSHSYRKSSRRPAPTSSDDLSTKEHQDPTVSSTDSPYWAVFHDHEGTSVRELLYNSAFCDAFCACSNFQCPPRDVCRLLLTAPDKTDSSLLGRWILNHVPSDSTLQWLIYSPKGMQCNTCKEGDKSNIERNARDYLILTSHESYDTQQDSFLLVSSSVDEICEEADDCEDTVPDIAAMARRNKSRRGQLKFRGFIGTSDGVGGTDLTVILSPEAFIAENQNETKSKRWLLRLNMQNELCDMITNIRTACCVTNGKSSERRNPMSRDRKKTPLRGREDSSLRSCIDETFKSIRLPINAEGDRTEDRDGDEDGNGAMREIEVTLPVPQSHSGNKSKSKGIGRTVLTAVSDLLRTRHFKRSKVFDNPCDPPMQDSFSSRLYSDALTTPSASTREVKNHYRIETAIPDTTVNDCYDQRWFPKSGVGRAHVRNRMIEDVTNGDPCHRVCVDLRKPLDPDPLNSGMFHRNISKSHCREEGKMEEKEFLNYDDEVTLQFYARDDDMESPAPRGCPTSSTDVSNGTDTAGEISPCSFESPSPRWSGVGNTHSHSSESVSDSTPCSRRDSPVGMKCDTGHLTPGDVSVELFLNEAMELCDSGFRLLSIYMGSKNEYTLSTLKNSVAFDVDWQSKGSRHGVCVESSMVAGSTWQAVRAVSCMTSDKQSILQLLTDDSRMHQFDNMFDFAVPLIKVDERSALRRLCFKPVWPTAPRDFLCYTAWTELEDGSILVCSQSVPDTLLAVQKGYVRGRIVVSGYWIQPLHTLKSCDPYYNPHSSRGCKVTLAAHTELGGSLPASVINMLSTAAPLKIMAAVADLVCSDSI